MSQALLRASNCSTHLRSSVSLIASRRGGSLPRVRRVHRRRTLLVQAAEIEDHVNSNGFFTDAFKAALSTAVRRQSNSGTADEHGDEYVSSNGNGYARLEYEAVYEPPPNRIEEVSASEEVLLTTLQQCQANLRVFTAMAHQLDAVIDREKRQVERLQFALEKCKMDNAYYRTLEALAERRNSRNS